MFRIILGGKIMTYSNGIKEYLLSGLIFGGIMGACFGLIYFSLIVGVLSGILSGFLFAFLIFLFCKVQEKKFDKMRVEIAQERRIICDGGATVQGTGGWLFFTDHGLEFYPHKINFSQEELIIPIEMIKEVKTHKNQIVIDTTEDLTFAILVSHNKDWQKQIEDYLKKFVNIAIF